MRIMFMHEQDILKLGSSENTTIHSMFGDEIFKNSYIVRIINNQKLSITYNERTQIDILNKKSISRLLKECKPDIIYTASSSFKFLLLLAQIKFFHGIPILIHYYDNWRECGRQKYKNLLLKYIEDKKIGALTISKKMAEAYSDKYKGTYHTYMALSPFTTPPRKYISNQLRADFKKHFVYAGGLHLLRHEMLLQVETALTNYDDCILDIYTDEAYITEYSSMFNSQITHFHAPIRREELMNVYADSYALVYVENVTDDNHTFVKYSMSTKIPEYLSAGKPIICMSRPGTASYDFLKENHAAFFADEANEFRQILEKISSNEAIVTKCITNAADAYKNNFNTSIKREELISLLNKLNK